MIVTVLGMHRTGSSGIAGVLNYMGVDMGAEPIAVSKHNPKGYFEDRDFQNLNRKMLKQAGGNWMNLPDIDRLHKIGSLMAPQIKRLVNKRINKHGDKPWGWKDPRTSLTIDNYRCAIDLNKIKYLVSWRNSNNTVDSLIKRNGFNRSFWLKLTGDYYKRLTSSIGKMDNVMLVDFKRLLSDKSMLNRIAEFVELKPDDETLTKCWNFLH